MRNKKKDHVTRLDDAQTVVNTALTAFEQAAFALEDAADTAAAVVTDVEVQVQQLTQTRDLAFRREAAYKAQADKIREFLK